MAIDVIHQINVDGFRRAFRILALELEGRSLRHAYSVSGDRSEPLVVELPERPGSAPYRPKDGVWS